MGALFSAGWSLQDVLSLSWEQLSFVVTTVNGHQTQILRTIQEAIVVSMGGSIKDKKNKTKKRRPPKASTDEERAAREQVKLAAMQQMGISVGPESQ